jgi:hypothetical protein
MGGGVVGGGSGAARHVVLGRPPMYPPAPVFSAPAACLPLPEVSSSDSDSDGPLAGVGDEEGDVEDSSEEEEEEEEDYDDLRLSATDPLGHGAAGELVETIDWSTGVPTVTALQQARLTAAGRKDRQSSTSEGTTSSISPAKSKTRTRGLEVLKSMGAPGSGSGGDSGVGLGREGVVSPGALADGSVSHGRTGVPLVAGVGAGVGGVGAGASGSVSAQGSVVAPGPPPRRGAGGPELVFESDTSDEQDHAWEAPSVGAGSVGGPLLRSPPNAQARRDVSSGVSRHGLRSGAEVPPTPYQGDDTVPGVPPHASLLPSLSELAAQDPRSAPLVPAIGMDDGEQHRALHRGPRAVGVPAPIETSASHPEEAVATRGERVALARAAGHPAQPRPPPVPTLPNLSTLPTLPTLSVAPVAPMALAVAPPAPPPTAPPVVVGIASPASPPLWSPGTSPRVTANPVRLNADFSDGSDADDSSSTSHDESEGAYQGQGADSGDEGSSGGDVWCAERRVEAPRGTGPRPGSAARAPLGSPPRTVPSTAAAAHHGQLPFGVGSPAAGVSRPGMATGPGPVAGSLYTATRQGLRPAPPPQRHEGGPGLSPGPGPVSSPGSGLGPTWQRQPQEAPYFSRGPAVQTTQSQRFSLRSNAGHPSTPGIVHAGCVVWAPLSRLPCIRSSAGGVHTVLFGRPSPLLLPLYLVCWAGTD